MESNIERLKLLSKRSNPLYKEILRAIEIVKDFIRSKQLILYGGTAIDMALRLKGHKLYEDDAMPDLDFVSWKSAEHSYELSDILFNAGFNEARSIVAIFLTTMKNDIGDNNFVADIKYLPKSVFDVIPTLMYDGMKFVHPLWQFLDVHSALSFPFDNPPTEVIFDRWTKDIKRFNMMLQHYPVEFPKINSDTKINITVPERYRALVWNGCAAYAFIYKQYVEIVEKLHLNPENLPKISPSTLTATEEGITIATIDGAFVVSHYDVEKCVSDYALLDAQHFRPFGSAFSERVEANKHGMKIRVCNTHGKMLSINEVEYGGAQYRIVNVQGCMLYFLGCHFVYRTSNPELSTLCLSRYVSLLHMTFIGDVAKGTDAEEMFTRSALHPSVNVYGKTNSSKQNEYILSMIYEKIDGSEPMKKPFPYFPHRRKPHPTFNYAEAESFLMDGSLITR